MAQTASRFDAGDRLPAGSFRVNLSRLRFQVLVWPWFRPAALIPPAPHPCATSAPPLRHPRCRSLSSLSLAGSLSLPYFTGSESASESRAFADCTESLSLGIRVPEFTQRHFRAPQHGASIRPETCQPAAAAPLKPIPRNTHTHKHTHTHTRTRTL